MTMNRRRFILTSAAFVGGFLTTGGTAWANKAQTEMMVPGTAVKGSEIPIKMKVTHSANNFLHHTEWLWVKVNGKEFARWDFSSSNLPEGAVFTREVKVKVNGDLIITAKASCNIHGSANEASAKVTAT
jgi:desulfoferrodoxin (superoxide reductase-like protein)